MDIIQISLDLLVIITKYQTGRELLREHNIYYVIRDMHMGKRIGVISFEMAFISRAGRASSSEHSRHHWRPCNSFDGR